MKKITKLVLSILLVSQANWVFSQPTIASFTPASGIVGSTVTINGTGFNTTAANNVVIFGTTRAAVTAASATQLTVTVPIGATYAPITVLNSATGLFQKQLYSNILPKQRRHYSIRF
jgi:hypothetical protein